MHKNELTKEYYISQFKSGKTVREIANENNVSYQKVYSCIKNIKESRITYKTFTKDQSKDIIDKYISGNSTVTIGKEYNVGHKVIANLLEKYGIKRDGKSRRKYDINENYFDIIDTPNKAYILGLLYADGSNCRNKCTVSISQQEEDKDILEKIRIELNYSKELDFIDYSQKNDYGYNYKNQYRLSIFSFHICDELIKKGMVPNKSLILQFPDCIEPELYSHFIRGYFDGDGSFSPNYSKENKFHPMITFTSTYQFCNSIREILKKHLGISAGNIYDASCHNDITKVLSISGNQQVKKILDWIYKDADMFLQRKYDKYISSFNDSNNSNND